MTTRADGELVRDPSHAATLAPMKSEEEERNTLLYVSGWALLCLAGVLCILVLRHIWRLYRETKTPHVDDGCLSSPRSVNEMLAKSNRTQVIPQNIHEENDTTAIDGPLLPERDPKDKPSFWSHRRPGTTTRIQAFFVRMTDVLSPTNLSSILSSEHDNENSSTMEQLSGEGSDESPAGDIEAPVQLSMDGEVVRPTGSVKLINALKEQTQRIRTSKKGAQNIKTVSMKQGHQEKEGITVDNHEKTDTESQRCAAKKRIPTLEYLKPRRWRDWKFLFNDTSHSRSTTESDPVTDEENKNQEGNLSKRLVVERKRELKAIYNKNRHSERQESDYSTAQYAATSTTNPFDGTLSASNRVDTPTPTLPIYSVSTATTATVPNTNVTNEVYPKPSVEDATLGQNELLDRKILGTVTYDVGETEADSSGHSRELPPPPTNSPKSLKGHCQYSPKNQLKKGRDSTSRVVPKQTSKSPKSKKISSPKRLSPTRKEKNTGTKKESPARKISSSPNRKSPGTKSKKANKVAEESEDLDSLQIPTLLPQLAPLPFFPTTIANEDIPSAPKNAETTSVENTQTSVDSDKQTEEENAELMPTNKVSPLSDNLNPPAEIREIQHLKSSELRNKEMYFKTNQPVNTPRQTDDNQSRMKKCREFSVHEVATPSEEKVKPLIPKDGQKLPIQEVVPPPNSPSQKQPKKSQVGALQPSSIFSLPGKEPDIDEDEQLNLSRRSAPNLTKAETLASNKNLESKSAHSAPSSPKKSSVRPEKTKLSLSSPQRKGELKTTKLDGNFETRIKKKVVKKTVGAKAMKPTADDTAVPEKSLDKTSKSKKKVAKKLIPKRAGGAAIKTTTEGGKEGEKKETSSPTSTVVVSTSSPSDPTCQSSEGISRKSPATDMAHAVDTRSNSSPGQDFQVSSLSHPIVVDVFGRKDETSTVSSKYEPLPPRSISVRSSSSTPSSLDMSHPYTQQKRRQRKGETKAGSKRTNKGAMNSTNNAEPPKHRPLKKKKIVKKKTINRPFKFDSPPLTIFESSCQMEEMSEITVICYGDSERSIIGASTFEPHHFVAKKKINQAGLVKNLVTKYEAQTTAPVGRDLDEKQEPKKHLMTKNGGTKKGKDNDGSEFALVEGLRAWLANKSSNKSPSRIRPPVPFDSVSVSKSDGGASSVSSISDYAS